MAQQKSPKQEDAKKEPRHASPKKQPAKQEKPKK